MECDDNDEENEYDNGGSEEAGDDDEEINYQDPPEGMIRMRPSKFNDIPGTIFIEYPPELGIKRNDISNLENLGSRKLFYSSYWGRNCIKNAFKRAGFERLEETTPSGLCTAMWSKHLPPSILKNFNCLQKMNHFPGSWCLGRKDRLNRTIAAMKKLHGDLYNFHPEGFVLPGDMSNLDRVVKNDFSRCSNGSEPLWICKPVASSCGRGIKVLTAEKVQAFIVKGSKKRVIMQRYMANPYLIEGKKFDLRIYVLVTGADPLRIYIHREGLTRISTHRYSLNNTKNRYAHLTNYSINKNSKLFTTATAPNVDDPTSSYQAGETEGFKWSLNAFRRWLSIKESPAICENVFKEIDNLIVKTIIAAESDLTHSLHSEMNYRTGCFELFGFDIILDDQLVPHLLEVNVSPSLMGGSPLDVKIKGMVIADTFHIAGFQPYDKERLDDYARIDKSARPSSAPRRPSKRTNGADSVDSLELNPFTFSSLSRMLSSQDAWRKDPSPHTVDMSAVGGNTCCWLLLLMTEDEIDRAKSSMFRMVHPIPQTLLEYLPLYKTPRFSDHLLGRWVLGGMSNGTQNKKYLPKRFACSQSIAINTLESRRSLTVSDTFVGLGSCNVSTPSKPKIPNLDVTSHKTSFQSPHSPIGGRKITSKGISVGDADEVFPPDKASPRPRLALVSSKGIAIASSKQLHVCDHDDTVNIILSSNSAAASAMRRLGYRFSDSTSPSIAQGATQNKDDTYTISSHRTMNVFMDEIKQKMAEDDSRIEASAVRKQISPRGLATSGGTQAVGAVRQNILKTSNQSSKSSTGEITKSVVPQRYQVIGRQRQSSHLRNGSSSQASAYMGSIRVDPNYADDATRNVNIPLSGAATNASKQVEFHAPEIIADRSSNPNQDLRRLMSNMRSLGVEDRVQVLTSYATSACDTITSSLQESGRRRSGSGLGGGTSNGTNTSTNTAVTVSQPASHSTNCPPSGRRR